MWSGNLLPNIAEAFYIVVNEIVATVFKFSTSLDYSKFLSRHGSARHMPSENYAQQTTWSSNLNVSVLTNYFQSCEQVPNKLMHRSLVSFSLDLTIFSSFTKFKSSYARNYKIFKLLTTMHRNSIRWDKHQFISWHHSATSVL